MVNEETVKAFMENRRFHISNNTDTFYSSAIPAAVKHDVRRNFGIDIEEEILMVRDTSFWNTRDQGCVITDGGIYVIPDNDDPEKSFHIPWGPVDHVVAKDNVFYFYDSEGRYSSIDAEFFMKEITFARVVWLAEALNKMAATQWTASLDDIYNQTMAEADKYEENGEIGKAIGVLQQFRETQNNEATAWRIALLYDKQGNSSEGLRVLDESIDNLPEDSYQYRSLFNALKYSIEAKTVNMGDANGKITDNGCTDMQAIKSMRQSCYYVKKFAPSDYTFNKIELNSEANKDFKTFENAISKNFSSFDYKDRKLIMPVKEYPQSLNQQEILLLDIGNLPENLIFPLGHPKANTLYVGHPMLPNKYIPFENYELELLEDKLRELCFLLQKLGATEISIESVNSSKKEANTDTNVKAKADAAYGFLEGNGNVKSNSKYDFLEEISKSIGLHQEFAPQSLPELPSNLVWYPGEPSWQRLAKQRLEGGLTYHEERIETKKTQVVEGTELQQAKLDIENLFAELNLNLSQSIKEKFKDHEHAIISIKVKFAAMSTLSPNGSSSTSDNQTTQKQLALQDITQEEKDYVNEYKACLEEDGEITSGARRLLDRLSSRLKISPKRVAELEQMSVIPQLTPDEQEYLDEYKECLKDDYSISPRERRLLDKLRSQMGISEERGLEIEALCSSAR